MTHAMDHILYFIRLYRVHLVFLGLLLCSLFSTEGWSYTKRNKSNIYKDVDITVAIKIFDSAVFQLKQDYETFHWETTGNDGDGEEQVKIAKTMGRSFWNWFGPTETQKGGYYGYGLYVAVDPIITNNYGSADSNWSLLKLTLPQGLKVLNINDVTFSNSLDPAKHFFSEGEIHEFKSILQSFNCAYGTTRVLNGLFGDGGAYLRPECRGLVKRIFSEILKIDAFMYQYHKQNYHTCEEANSNEFNETKGAYPNGKALVILTSHWMNQNNVKFYNQNSTYDEETRIKIQTLFLKNPETYVSGTEKALKTMKQIKEKLLEILSSNLEMTAQEITSTCDSQNCSLQLKICDPKNQCENRDLGVYPLFKASDNDLITTEEAKLGTYNSSGVVYRRGYQLLWKNLEGKQKNTHLSEWVKSFIGCSGESPFLTK